MDLLSWETLVGFVIGVAFSVWIVRSGRTTDDRSKLYELAEKVGEDYDRAANPEDFAQAPRFLGAVQHAGKAGFSNDELLAYYTGDNLPVACIALAVLAKRRDDAELREPVLAGLNNVSFYTRWFALRLLEDRVEGSLLGAVVARLDKSWRFPLAERVLVDFVRRRVANGDTEVGPDAVAELDGEVADWLADALRRAGLTELCAVVERARHDRVDLGLLRGIGRVWNAEDIPAPIEDPVLTRRVAEIELALSREPPRSVLVVGEPGVGKTAALRALGRRLIEQDWILFEAGAVELLAGQTYIGQLEERLQALLGTLAGKPKVAWIVPDLQELAVAGKHHYSQSSVLDFVRPWMEDGRIRVVGEILPAAHERLLQSQPRLRTITETVRLSPTGDEETIALARAWSDRHARAGAAGATIAPDLLQLAFQLSQQFLGAMAQPGNLLGYLELCRQSRVVADPQQNVTLTIDDLLHTLSRVTGLPRSILDEREGLDLDALERFFKERVVGQPEAVQCLVERVALIKAGLTDPTRPMGVFLFTGPTGTGKTEIAKTLAEFLFGSSDRMTRLDMSELQEPSSLDRILGDRFETDGTQTALVHEIRKNPFSVVLLDEIEKAHALVWDLFLQVFDDGRLTDRRGHLADFRHAIVIMTSNVGSDATHGGGLGFAPGKGHGIADAAVEKSLTSMFRREFLNRIDRIVVFRPLSRAVMRRVLLRELGALVERRGLRNRQWAVEWDESALDFFLDAGFSPELGARPLKRVIERALLAPLARTIVHHQVPEGDQFLFVRSDGKGVQVEFVDPDADSAAAAVPASPAGSRETSLDVATIAFEAAGTSAEIETLRASFAALQSRVASAEWQGERAAGLAATSEPDFWTSDERFAVLGRTEYLDRIEAGVESAGKLLQRVVGAGRNRRSRAAPELVRSLATQLYLLESAVHGLDERLPRDAYLQVESVRDARAEADAVDAFAFEIATMYERWARARRMHWRELDRRRGDDEPFWITAAVTGYGCFPILADETGLHTLETGNREKRSLKRMHVNVRVVPQPDAPTDDERRLARQCLAATKTAPKVVRRYRRPPAPLIRDAVRGWKTGRWDRVLNGDFDLVR